MRNSWQHKTRSTLKKSCLGTTDYKCFATPCFCYWDTLNIGNGIALNLHFVWSSCLLCPDVYNSTFSLWVGLTKKLICPSCPSLHQEWKSSTFCSEIPADSEALKMTQWPSCQEVLSNIGRLQSWPSIWATDLKQLKGIWHLIEHLLMV